jgi:HPt (histidine-containing phosphotransfer) domain-containing protein
MNRREALFATGALLAAAGTAQAADHSHHHHDGAHPWQAVLDTAGICIEKGEVCLTHCIMLLGEGDKAMAACATSVREMLASCRALISSPPPNRSSPPPGRPVRGRLQGLRGRVQEARRQAQALQGVHGELRRMRQGLQGHGGLSQHAARPAGAQKAERSRHDASADAFRIPSTASTRPPGCVAWKATSSSTPPCCATSSPPSDAAQAIADALARDDRAAATRRAHTVKGLAGTFGAVRLQPAAQSLEAALRDGAAAGPVAERLACFEAALAALVDALEAGLPPEDTHHGQRRPSTRPCWKQVCRSSPA